MRARHHRLRVVVASLAPSVDVADAVDRHLEPSGFELVHDVTPALAVFLREGDAANAYEAGDVVVVRADAAERLEAGGQPGRVDVQSAHVVSFTARLEARAGRRHVEQPCVVFSCIDLPARGGFVAEPDQVVACTVSSSRVAPVRGFAAEARGVLRCVEPDQIATRLDECRLEG